MPLLVGRLPSSVLPTFAITAFAHFFLIWLAVGKHARQSFFGFEPFGAKGGQATNQVGKVTVTKNIGIGMGDGVGTEKLCTYKLVACYGGIVSAVAECMLQCRCGMLDCFWEIPAALPNL